MKPESRPTGYIWGIKGQLLTTLIPALKPGAGVLLLSQGAPSTYQAVNLGDMLSQRPGVHLCQQLLDLAQEAHLQWPVILGDQL